MRIGNKTSVEYVEKRYSAKYIMEMVKHKQGKPKQKGNIGNIGLHIMHFRTLKELPCHKWMQINEYKIRLFWYIEHRSRHMPLDEYYGQLNSGTFRQLQSIIMKLTTSFHQKLQVEHCFIAAYYSLLIWVLFSIKSSIRKYWMYSCTWSDFTI